MNAKLILAACALTLLATGASAGPKGDNGQKNGFVSANGVALSQATEVTVSTATFMGWSGKAAPNAHAAASAGARVETTTTTTMTTVSGDVTGPKGEVEAGNFGCNACSTTNETTSVDVTSETTVDGPGKN